MSKPIAIIFNDVHIKSGNEQDIISSIRYMIKYATEKNITNLIFAGDMFESRSFQRQDVLQALDKILDLINKSNLRVYMFAGNHDKTLYNSFDSFLDIYRFHPSVIFNKDITDIEIEGVKITLLPFFSDDLLIPMIEEHKGGDVLISHFEMAGSTMLGKVSEKVSINKRLLRKWTKVYLGHYHNYHEISKNIVHLPSLRQDSFGEDNVKGFSVLYKDLSYELVKGKFKEFEKIQINIDDSSLSDIKELVKLHKNSDKTVRFEFKGTESKLKSLDKSQFKGTGIDVKVVFDTKYNFEDDDLPEITEKYGIDEVKSVFKEFCTKKGYDFDYGSEILKEFLKNKA